MYISLFQSFFASLNWQSWMTSGFQLLLSPPVIPSFFSFLSAAQVRKDWPKDSRIQATLQMEPTGQGGSKELLVRAPGRTSKQDLLKSRHFLGRHSLMKCDNHFGQDWAKPAFECSQYSFVKEVMLDFCLTQEI